MPVFDHERRYRLADGSEFVVREGAPMEEPDPYARPPREGYDLFVAVWGAIGMMKMRGR